jgi:DNA-3-methyladenine glycosylase II
MWWPDIRIRDNHRRRAAQRQAEARAAAEHLRRTDARFAELIDRFGLERPVITADPFVALVGSIVQQQISMGAANAIYGRLRALCPRRRVTPAALLALDDATLRGAGLSRQKIRYTRELAAHFADGRLRSARLRRMTDDEVIAATTRVVGIGRWTAEMLLIFCLERPDVWPVDDLGLRKAVQRFCRKRAMPAPRAIERLADPWRPFRSYATWYLWRSLEGEAMPGVRVGE